MKKTALNLMLAGLLALSVGAVGATLAVVASASPDHPATCDNTCTFNGGTECNGQACNTCTYNGGSSHVCERPVE